jgi:hypothetical protein
MSDFDREVDGSADAGLSLTREQVTADAADLQASLADPAGLVTGSLGLEQLLARVASFAARAIPGADGGPKSTTATAVLGLPRIRDKQRSAHGVRPCISPDHGTVWPGRWTRLLTRGRISASASRQLAAD